MKSDRQISLRVPQSFIDRAEKLAAKLKKLPQYQYVPRIGMSFVLRVAVERGLAHLEQNEGKSRKRR